MISEDSGDVRLYHINATSRIERLDVKAAAIRTDCIVRPSIFAQCSEPLDQEYERMTVRRTQLCRVVTSHQLPRDYSASPESAMEFCFSAAGCSGTMLGETPTIS